MVASRSASYRIMYGKVPSDGGCTTEREEEYQTGARHEIGEMQGAHFWSLLEPIGRVLTGFDKTDLRDPPRAGLYSVLGTGANFEQVLGVAGERLGKSVRGRLDHGRDSPDSACDMMHLLWPLQCWHC